MHGANPGPPRGPLTSERRQRSVSAASACHFGARQDQRLAPCRERHGPLKTWQVKGPVKQPLGRPSFMGSWPTTPTTPTTRKFIGFHMVSSRISSERSDLFDCFLGYGSIIQYQHLRITFQLWSCYSQDPRPRVHDFDQ